MPKLATDLVIVGTSICIWSKLVFRQCSLHSADKSNKWKTVCKESKSVSQLIVGVNKSILQPQLLSSHLSSNLTGKFCKSGTDPINFMDILVQLWTMKPRNNQNAISIHYFFGKESQRQFLLSLGHTNVDIFVPEFHLCHCSSGKVYK